MEKIRIKSINEEYFDRVWEIYEYSFPISEKRTIEHQIKAFESPDYYLYAYKDKDIIVGLIGYWEFPDYLFVEHYAMAKECRGDGYGTKILGDITSNTKKLIVVEIDEVIDEVAERRLRFYQHLNFLRNPFKHLCHTYRDGCPQEKLEVLTYPTTIDREFYNKFNNDLANVVMKR